MTVSSLLMYKPGMEKISGVAVLVMAAVLVVATAAHCLGF